jgi:hypothetical protein
MGLRAEADRAPRERKVGAPEAGEAALDVPHEDRAFERLSREPDAERGADAEDSERGADAVERNVQDGREHEGEIRDAEAVVGLDEQAQDDLQDDHRQERERDPAQRGVRISADGREHGDQAGEEGDRRPAEEQREDQGIRRQRPAQARVGGGEVHVRLLDAERRETRREPGDRRQERDLPTAFRAEGACDHEHVAERQEGGGELRCIRLSRRAREGPRSGRRGVGRSIPHYHRRVIAVAPFPSTPGPPA